jgi:hypothetical protein
MNITNIETVRKSMEIVGRALANCQIDPTGDSFRLNFEGADGKPASVTLPVDCGNSLLMTLPKLLEQALKVKYRDDTLKLVYPTGKWSLEAGIGMDCFILTLTTPDGFKVSFALSREDADGLASSLGEAEVDTSLQLPS